MVCPRQREAGQNLGTQNIKQLGSEQIPPLLLTTCTQTIPTQTIRMHEQTEATRHYQQLDSWSTQLGFIIEEENCWSKAMVQRQASPPDALMAEANRIASSVHCGRVDVLAFSIASHARLAQQSFRRPARNIGFRLGTQLGTRAREHVGFWFLSYI